jgi:hypothetical protein
MYTSRLWLAAVVVFSVIGTGFAQPPAGAPDVPVKRIVLFSSGVGYFQREGRIEGSARLDLQFPAPKINDLLKSLVLQDMGGGRISTVSYDNRDPIEKTLKSFAIDLTSEPSLADLLSQVRGEKIEVTVSGEVGTIAGTIVGVETQQKAAGNDNVVDVERLNLLTEEGLRGVDLPRAQRIRFTRAELEQEFRKALDTLTAGRDKRKKTVSLHFSGNGNRSVRVGYITENPIWKTSYRLLLDPDGKRNQAYLQGWAIVENTTDEDWNDVRLGLVSGRPISFQMDLYEPLYVPRPLVEPELFASLRPQLYSGGLAGVLGGVAGGAGIGGGFGGGLPGLGALGALGQPGAINPAGQPGGEDTRAYARNRRAGGAAQEMAGRKSDTGIPDMRQSVASAALAAELGGSFRYEIEQPISIARQKSALIPIVATPVNVSRVSIYNAQVHEKYPLFGLYFKNTTGLHLMQGPLTVFEQQSYAGDARIGDLEPNESRLLSYAVDLGTEVVPEAVKPLDDLVAVKVFKGILHATHRLRRTATYTVRNRSEHDRRVIIEHPYQTDWALVTPDKPAERSRDVYRFEVKVGPNKTEKLRVIEEQGRKEETVLLKADDEAIRVFVRSSVGSAMVKDALQQALKLRADFAQAESAVSKEERGLQTIERDQERMRANMARVPPTSEAYKRYLRKFDDQETRLRNVERRSSRCRRMQTCGGRHWRTSF